MKLLILVLTCLITSVFFAKAPSQSQVSLNHSIENSFSQILDEENLEVEEIKPGSVTNSLLKIDKVIENGKEFIKIEFDFASYLKEITDIAESLGLLNGKTNFEKNKGNLVVDGTTIFKQIINYVYFRGNNDFSVTRLDSPYSKGFNSLNENFVKIKYVPNIERVISSLNVKSSDFLFYNKSNVIAQNKQKTSSWEGVWDHNDLFHEEGKKYEKDQREFFPLEGSSSLNYFNETRFVPQSKTITIYKANQPSIKRKFSKGYNFDVKFNNYQQNVNVSRFYFIILFLLGLIIVPFSYFIIKRLLRKKWG